MLQIKRMEGDSFAIDDTGDTLFQRNPILKLHIKAPMYWWIDADFHKWNMYMPTHDFEYCLDAWEGEGKSVPYIGQMKSVIENAKLEPRQLLQILPLSTYLEGAVELSYREIVEVCENYSCGEYDYKELYNQWPMSREWTDFCETLMDIRGVREIIKKEGIN
jgi:hypothetical protein